MLRPRRRPPKTNGWPANRPTLAAWLVEAWTPCRFSPACRSWLPQVATNSGAGHGSPSNHSCIRLSASKAYSFHRVGSLCRCLSGNKDDGGSMLIGVSYAQAMLCEELHGKHQADENQGRDDQPQAVFSTKSSRRISNACVPKGGTAIRASGPRPTIQ